MKARTSCNLHGALRKSTYIHTSIKFLLGQGRVELHTSQYTSLYSYRLIVTNALVSNTEAWCARLAFWHAFFLSIVGPTRVPPVHQATRGTSESGFFALFLVLPIAFI